MVAAAAAAMAARGEDELAERRAALEKWMDTRRMISAERQDWRVARELLQDRADALRRDVDAWREKIGQVAQEIATAERESTELEAKRTALQEGVAGVAETLARLERELRATLARCPAPLQERVKLLSERLPDDSANTKASLGERAQNVVGILNEIDKFAREITVSSEVRELADGSSAEVTVLYVGLGQAYYCNAMRGVAGIGRPGAAGWEWEPRNEIVEAVAAAVAVYRNERPAAYVVLPAVLR
jgi:chromosome segregation ATPase